MNTELITIMTNILITGANGFIGVNLIKTLELYKEFNILKITRDSSLIELEKLIIKSDFIFHLAGEVRPNSSADDFKESNVNLTQNIISLLEKNNKIIPILLTSTIHAKLLKNEYGKTKRKSELLIENYSKNNKVNCVIYRLPHVFGEGCKANYNSVISTWIYNSVNDLEINVFDRSIAMQYVYVQDIVKEFINFMNNNIEELYIDPNLVYNTTLGEIIDYLVEFKKNINTDDYNIGDNEFKNKLYITYKDYNNKKLENK